ncbi:MAG TPA: TetR/AcrR family transcriptional regulator [Acidimicrobiales bacterium]|nr:TetR/AcrR family transcriptional regulator [Acidimicrobiales bacterium]
MSTRLPAARRRRQLLEVALHVFAKQGFYVTSMSDIAEAAGVTKPVLYQHFVSKRQLYGQLLAEVGSQIQEAITKAVASASSPREQVERGFAAYFTFVDDHRDSFRLFYTRGSSRDEEFSAITREVENTIAEQVAGLIEIEGLTAEQRRLLGHGIVGMIEGASTRWMTSDAETDPQELARQLADLAWRGLRGVRPDG